jgi:hypothetical protein
VNLNFMNRYEDLRNRFLEGETESIYTELIKANREALTPENGVLVPEIISRIQHFLERIAILVNPPSIEQEYGEPESNPANQVTRFDRIILDPGNSQSHIKKDDEINNIPKKRPEKKSIEKNETTIYWPSHHSET